MDYTGHGTLQARILKWLAFPSLLQWIFPNPGIKPRSPALQWILYQLSHQGSPRILEWVAYPFSSGSSRPGSPALQVDFFYQLSYQGSTWISPDGQYRNQIDDILCSQRWRSSIQSPKIRLGADCGSDHELLIAKFRLKESRKTTRPLMYDLNQIPYAYTVEMTNRFKGLDLINRVPEELWTDVHDIVQEAVIKTITKKKKCKKAKSLSEEGLQIAEKKREAKGKGEKERYTHLNAEFQRIARRDKKEFLSDQCKEIEGNNRMGKTRDLFKKIRDTKGTFHAKMGQ